MSLSLIIFDCDGVILESVEAKTRAFARVGAGYGDEASQRLVEYHREHGGVSRFKKFAWLFEQVLGRPVSEQDMHNLGERFADYCLDEVIRSDLVPGIMMVLDRWKGVVPMYVASGTPQKELEDVLAARGLAPYFAGICGTPPGKADLLRNILKETGAHPSSVVMVGDSSTDQYAAEAVRCLFYGRGEYFRHSEYPWHDDLTRLNEYLEELHQEP